MSDFVLFQMWEPHRRSLIEGQQFYAEQASKRLLSQFEDMESEADKAAEAWLKARSQHFDPDRHDPGDFYEDAHDAGIEFYQMLSDLRDQTRLSVIAGMYHEWDKQLRDWLTREMDHWHHGATAASKVWAADFDAITDLLESLGWPIRSGSYFRQLDACRLIVNVYKHGKGNSLEALKKRYPEYLRDPFEGMNLPSSDSWLDHSHLDVTDSHSREFSDAIIAFWEAVPENIFRSQVTEVPDWFGKAILKDQGPTPS